MESALLESQSNRNRRVFPSFATRSLASKDCTSDERSHSTSHDSSLCLPSVYDCVMFPLWKVLLSFRLCSV